MKVRTQDYNEVTVVELQGELDSDFIELFVNTIAGIIENSFYKSEQSGKPITIHNKLGIVLDMSNVGFIDGEGLERLLWARDYCKDNDCQFRLAGLDENCKKILEITRLENGFDRYAELAEAVKSFV